MPYLAKSDMVALFGETELIQLTDRANLGVIDDAVLAVAMTYAEDLFDAIIPRAIRPDTTKFITNLVADIARWRLYDDVVPDNVQARYTEAMRLLRDAAAGRANLGVSEITGELATVSSSVKATKSKRVFGAATLSDY